MHGIFLLKCRIIFKITSVVSTTVFFLKFSSFKNFSGISSELTFFKEFLRILLPNLVISCWRYFCILLIPEISPGFLRNTDFFPVIVETAEEIPGGLPRKIPGEIVGENPGEFQAGLPWRISAKLLQEFWKKKWRNPCKQSKIKNSVELSKKSLQNSWKYSWMN